jgi:hypothetical protein
MAQTSAGYTGNNPLSTAMPNCGGSYGIQSTDCSNQLVQSYSILLTPAQIDVMYTTPIVLLPQPVTLGLLATNGYAVDNVTFKYIYGGTVFTGGGAISFQYSGGATVVTTIAATALTTAANSAFYLGGNTTTTIPLNTAVTMTNATGVFAAGSGSVQVVVNYTVI